MDEEINEEMEEGSKGDVSYKVSSSSDNSNSNSNSNSSSSSSSSSGGILRDLRRKEDIQDTNNIIRVICQRFGHSSMATEIPDTYEIFKWPFKHNNYQFSLALLGFPNICHINPWAPWSRGNQLFGFRGAFKYFLNELKTRSLETLVANKTGGAIRDLVTKRNNFNNFAELFTQEYIKYRVGDLPQETKDRSKRYVSEIDFKGKSDSATKDKLMGMIQDQDSNSLWKPATRPLIITYMSNENPCVVKIPDAVLRATQVTTAIAKQVAQRGRLGPGPDISKIDRDTIGERVPFHEQETFNKGCEIAGVDKLAGLYFDFVLLPHPLNMIVVSNSPLCLTYIGSVKDMIKSLNYYSIDYPNEIKTLSSLFEVKLETMGEETMGEETMGEKSVAEFIRIYELFMKKWNSIISTGSGTTRYFKQSGWIIKPYNIAGQGNNNFNENTWIRGSNSAFEYYLVILFTNLLFQIISSPATIYQCSLERYLTDETDLDMETFCANVLTLQKQNIKVYTNSTTCNTDIEDSNFESMIDANDYQLETLKKLGSLAPEPKSSSSSIPDEKPTNVGSKSPRGERNADKDGSELPEWVRMRPDETGGRSRKKGRRLTKRKRSKSAKRLRKRRTIKKRRTNKNIR